jgi:FMN phosphatase YigB (HAD superfamily)/DNA-binding XRE family transcriptional regulator
MGGIDEKALGKRLQLARRRAGLTQQELCQKASLSYSTLAKIERGAIRSPSVFTVAAIASATGTSVEEILGVKNVAGSPAPSEAKKTSKNGVKFIYFDVNGTLVRFFERAFTEIAAQSGWSPEIVETIYWRYDNAVCRGKVTNQKVNDIFAKQLNVDGFDWQKFYMENIEPTPHTPELIDWCAKNYNVGLLTNNWLGFTDDLIARKYIPPVNFTAVIESAKVGCTKPDDKIYEIAQELAGVKPGEIMLIDDNPAYLAAADKQGWQIIRFDALDPEGSVNRAKAALEF